MTATAQDLLFTPVSELRRQISAREISPVELVEASLARIEELNPTINAFIHVLADEARAAARESEARAAREEARPLEGIPIPIKDLFSFVAGAPVTLGSRGVPPGFAMPMDSEQVARLRAAGAVIVGITHMPEFGSTAGSASLRHGVTRNPWNLEHTPGGSSSGAAAAVAAGMVPAAHGADGGGSLRIPAACCGLYTMKPTRGRISTSPVADNFGLNVYGFLTRTVLDSALLLDQVHGYAWGDLYWASPVARPFIDEARDDPGKLRIGWTTMPPLEQPVHPACAAAVRDAAELCASLGHDVEEHNLAWRDPQASDRFIKVWSTQFGTLVESLIKLGFDPDQLEPHNRALWEISRTVTATDYTLALGAIRDTLRGVIDSWRTYHVILTPVTAQPPLRLDDLGPDPENPLAPLIRDATFVPFTATFNFTGQPAANWPLAWHEGLPIGVQAVGRPGDEATLFRLSAQVEAARPWSDRRPPLGPPPYLPPHAGGGQSALASA